MHQDKRNALWTRENHLFYVIQWFYIHINGGHFNGFSRCPQLWKWLKLLRLICTSRALNKSIMTRSCSAIMVRTMCWNAISWTIWTFLRFSVYFRLENIVKINLSMCRKKITFDMRYCGYKYVAFPVILLQKYAWMHRLKQSLVSIRMAVDWMLAIGQNCI